MLFILRPGDVGGNLVLKHHMVGSACASDTPCTGAPGLLLPGIYLASAIRVGAGIDRVLQQVLQGHTIGPAPLQRPFGGAFPHANPELNVVLYQIAQERMPRAKVLTLAKDQPDHLLDLFVRIIDDIAGRVVDIPHRQREAQCPPARFLPGALIHPLLEEMELRLTHGALESSQQAIIVLTRIIDPIEVRNQCPNQGTDLQQLMPIFGRARQA
jgi:hypothetical protein